MKKSAVLCSNRHHRSIHCAGQPVYYDGRTVDLVRVAMAQSVVIGVLSNKRTELAGIVRQLEQQLVQQRTNLAHLDATMRLFDPDIQPKNIPSQAAAGTKCLVSSRRVPSADLRPAA